MKHVKVFGGRLQRAKVFGGRLQPPSPFLICWAPRRARGWMLSQTREKFKKILYFDEVILRLRLYIIITSAASE